MRASGSLLLLTLATWTTAAEPDELVLLGKHRMIRVELRVEVNGKPLADAWDSAFRTLFTNLDRNGDGDLDAAEAERVPAALRVRQLSWGYFFTHPGDAPPRAELAGAASKVGPEQLATYYRLRGVGGVQVGVGVAPATEALTHALLKRLDRDRDGKVSATAWRAADRTLAALDLNEDELLAPNELVADLLYPGAQGNTLLTPPSQNDRTAQRDLLPLLRLPSDRENAHWAAALVSRRDQDRDGLLSALESGLSQHVCQTLDRNADGFLNAEELGRWRRRPADAALTVRLGTRKPGQAALEWQFGDSHLSAKDGQRLDVQAVDLRLTLGLGASRRVEEYAAAHKVAVERFGEADATGDATLERAEVARSTYPPLRAQFVAADRNADGRLTRKEWEDWLDVLGRLTTVQVVLAAVDQGRGLFELLDADRDGRLSVRELRNGLQRLEDTGCRVGDLLRTEKMPRHLLAAVAVGPPKLPPLLIRGAGPEWFRALDRNGDGDVSAREWVGRVEDFRTADADGDGLLSAAEAERVTPKKPESRRK